MRLRGGHGEHGDPHARRPDRCDHPGAILDGEGSDLGADLRWIVIEDLRHPEAAVGQALVTSHGAADIPGADNGDIPDPVNFEDLA